MPTETRVLTPAPPRPARDMPTEIRLQTPGPLPLAQATPTAIRVPTTGPRPPAQDMPTATRVLTTGPRPPAQDMPTATTVQITLTQAPRRLAQPMPTATSTTSTIPVWSTATGTATAMPATARRATARATAVESPPGEPARRCMAGVIRATAIPTTVPQPAGGVRKMSRPAVRSAPQQSAAAAYNYSQPISTTAAPPDQAIAGQATSAFDQAREAFKAGDYAQALQLDQQALAQMPNDTTMHEFLALVYFAQGKYDQAAAPLYAVLSVGPGWDWTTLSGMYADVATYTSQLRALEANLRANPDSAHGHFVLAYQYLAQGHIENGVAQLKQAVRLQPGDTLSAQLIAQLQPSSGTQPPPTSPPRPPRESWPATGRRHPARTRRSAWRSRTTAASPGPRRARAGRRRPSRVGRPWPTAF